MRKHMLEGTICSMGKTNRRENEAECRSYRPKQKYSENINRRLRLAFCVVNPRIAEIWREFLVRWSSSQANLFIMRKINRKEEVRQTMLSVRVAPTHLLPAGNKKAFHCNWRHAQ